MTEIEQLTQAIAALEAQRALLGEAVVEAALAPMREKLAALRSQTAHVTPAESLRRQVTVLFADVSGFTALSETLDAEDVTDLMNALWSRLDCAITAHGGRIDKHIGDAVMAVWGAEHAHENDPEQAIRAALDMQAAISDFKSQILNLKSGIAMRIGINTGPVLLGEVGTTHEFTAMGDTVNLASRLEHAAPVGGILIAHDTFRQVRGIFDVQVLEPLTVKGKAEPVQAYLVQRARPRAFRLGTRGVEGVETRMIGRAAELQRLQDLLRAVTTDRELQAVTVVGEPGVGKSRLLYEFTAWLDVQPEPYLIFKGRASEETARLPYALLRDLFAFRFEIQDSDPPAVAHEKLTRGIAQVEQGAPPNLIGEARDPIEMKAHFIGHLIGLDFSDSPYLRGILADPQQIHDRALHYLAQYFTAVAQARESAGVVLLLEDLHWADEGSLDALAHLMRNCCAAPLFMLGLARPILYERRPKWGEGLDAHTRLELRLLSKHESRLLVDEILQKVAAIPQALRELIVSGAEGNPFYVEELIKMLIDEQVIVPGAEHWGVMAERLLGIHVPSTLTGVLQARLDGLPAEERVTLQRASVIGRVFWDEAVRALNAEAKAEAAPEKLRLRLQALRAKELVFGREASTFAGVDEYIFKHALLRDVTYESVLKRQRKVYHAQAAHWLIERSGERADEYAGLIAEHFEQAGDIASAAEWYGRAGLQARATYAQEAAIVYLQKALQLQEQAHLSDSQTVFEWYVELVKALQSQMRLAEAVEAAVAMRLAAEAAGDVVAQACAWNHLAWLQARSGDYHAGLKSAEQADAAVQLARVQGVTPVVQKEWVNALSNKCRALDLLGDKAGTLALAQQVMALLDELSDTHDYRHVRAHGLFLLGALLINPGDFEQAGQYLEQALALYRELGDRREVGRTLSNLGANASERGDYATAMLHFQEALAIYREIGSQDLAATCVFNLGMTSLEQGDYTGAGTFLRQAINLGEAKESEILMISYGALAEICLKQGKVAESLDFAKQVLSTVQEAQSLGDVAQVWRSLGNCGRQILDSELCLADYNLPDEQLLSALQHPADCYAESANLFDGVKEEHERAKVLRDWARYEQAHSDREKGRALWQEAKAIFVQMNMPLEVARMEEEATQ